MVLVAQRSPGRADEVIVGRIVGRMVTSSAGIGGRKRKPIGDGSRGRITVGVIAAQPASKPRRSLGAERGPSTRTRRSSMIGSITPGRVDERSASARW